MTSFTSLAIGSGAFDNAPITEGQMIFDDYKIGFDTGGTRKRLANFDNLVNGCTFTWTNTNGTGSEQTATISIISPLGETLDTFTLGSGGSNVIYWDETAQTQVSAKFGASDETMEFVGFYDKRIGGVFLQDTVYNFTLSSAPYNEYSCSRLIIDKSDDSGAPEIKVVLTQANSTIVGEKKITTTSITTQPPNWAGTWTLDQTQAATLGNIWTRTA